MTADKARKRAIRERMACHGEPYSVAARMLTPEWETCAGCGKE